MVTWAHAHSRRGYADIARCVAALPGLGDSFLLGNHGGRRAFGPGAHLSSSRARAVAVGSSRARRTAAVYGVLDEERAPRTVLARRPATAELAALQHHNQVLPCATRSVSCVPVFFVHVRCGRTVLECMQVSLAYHCHRVHIDVEIEFDDPTVPGILVVM